MDVRTVTNVKEPKNHHTQRPHYNQMQYPSTTERAILSAYMRPPPLPAIMLPYLVPPDYRPPCEYYRKVKK